MQIAPIQKIKVPWNALSRFGSLRPPAARWPNTGPTNALTPNVMKLMAPVALPFTSSGLTSYIT